jgi:hypothetical protein
MNVESYVIYRACDRTETLGPVSSIIMLGVGCVRMIQAKGTYYTSVSKRRTRVGLEFIKVLLVD